MGTEHDVFEPEPKPEVKPDTKAKAKPEAVKPEAEEAPPNGLTREEFAKVRHDIFRMWHGEPEETR